MTKRKKIILFIITLFVTVIVTFGVYYLIITNKLSTLTYNIVEESCLSNADYDNSKYSEIISKNDYHLLNVFEQDSDCYDEIHIKHFSHTTPHITLINLTCAKAEYVYDVEYSTPRYYNRGAIPRCTLTWKLQSDGNWHVIDFYEHP